jgi:hypothetical protein
VRMTKPNSASSHDWHVQLCCQRSELHPPERAALDQGLAGIAGCVLELDGAVYIVVCLTGAPQCWGRPSTASLPLESNQLAGLIRTFEGHSVTSDVLRELSEIIRIPCPSQAIL